MEIISDSIVKEYQQRNSAQKSYDLLASIFRISYILSILVIPFFIMIILIPFLMATSKKIKRLNRKMIIKLVKEVNLNKLADIYKYMSPLSAWILIQKLLSKELKEYKLSEDLSMLIPVSNEPIPLNYDLKFLETMYIYTLQVLVSRQIGKLSRLLYDGFERQHIFSMNSIHLGKLIVGIYINNTSLAPSNIFEHIKTIHQSVTSGPFYKPTLKLVEKTLKNYLSVNQSSN